MRFLKFFVI